MTPSTAVLQLVPERPQPPLVYLGSLAPSSARTMEFALETAARWLSNDVAGVYELPWHELRDLHTARLQELLLRERYSPAYTNKIMSAVRGVLRWCRRLKLMSVDDYQAAIDFKTVKGRHLPSGRAVKREELQRLFEVCATNTTAAGARDAALIGLIVASGLRRSEAAALRLEDVTREEFGTGEITVREGKGRRARKCFASPGAMGLLSAWLDFRGLDAGPLFRPVNKAGTVQAGGITTQAVYNVTQKRAEEAGIARFSPHDLRRTFISVLLDAGADIVTVQKLAGHASVTTTAAYDRRGDEAKRRAVSLFELPI